MQSNEEGNFFLQAGIVLYSRSYYVLSLHSWNKALTYFAETWNRSGESACYTNLGVAYRDLGDFKKAIEYFEKSLQIKKEINDLLGESACYTNLGNAYSLGDLRKAIEYYEKSLQIKKEIGDRSGESKRYTNLGVAYGDLGDFRKAIEYYEKSLQIKKEINDLLGESACYNNLGVAYRDLDDFKKAIDHYEKSLQIAVEIGDRSGESKCYGNLGIAYRTLGDFRRTIEYYEKALKIAVEIGDRSGESKCYTNLGVAYDRLGDFKCAIEYYEKSLQIVRDMGDVEQEEMVNYNLGLAHHESNPRLAYDYFSQSIELSELIGGKLVEEHYQRGFQAKVSDAYQLMVPLCLKLEREREAFEYTERSKSRAFLDLMAATDIKPTVELTTEMKSLLKDEQSCLIDLRAIQTRHLRQTNAPFELGKVDEIREKLNQIYNKLEKLDPEYVFARRAKPLTLEGIQGILNSLKKETVLLEYFVTDKEIFIFVVSSKDKKLHVKAIKLPAEELDKYVSYFSREVADYDPKGKSVSGAWLGLSDYLIKPVSDLITGHELVYFVPYGQLHYLPLHALELEGEPLIKNYAVAYAPSASLIKFCQNKGSGKLQTCAAFGVALKNQENLEKIVDDTAKGVANLFGTEAFNNYSATKEKVLQEIGDKDIVHFSCHGYLDQNDPLSLGVVLYNEEILTAKEIFNLKLNAEIVSLGACQTGVSERSLGDELVGLTRAFLYAGTPSLIVSLWSVKASTTKELILEFYKQAKNGVDKATALQIAQKKIMTQEKYSHPYYWAPFI